jgi:hypothetical protein
MVIYHLTFFNCHLDTEFMFVGHEFRPETLACNCGALRTQDWLKKMTAENCQMIDDH